MDWSLVLASQEIAHVIASPDESGRWTLEVAPGDVSRASLAIRQYEAENRTRPWQHPYFEGRLVFDWVASVWVAALIAIHVAAEHHPALAKAGLMHGADVARGEWWRLITATQLHADWGHLASNLSIGFVLLGLVMGRWGTATGMLAALLAGVGGNVANWLLQPTHFSLGASTVVMGCVGLLAWMPRQPAQPARPVWSNLYGGVLAATMLFLLFGLDPRTDVLAHCGGFVTGLGLGFALRRRPAWCRSGRANAAATVLLAGLVLAAWLLARAHADAGAPAP
jgi:membrane associated rhomboid family serine protease